MLEYSLESIKKKKESKVQVYKMICKICLYSQLSHSASAIFFNTSRIIKKKKKVNLTRTSLLHKMYYNMLLQYPNNHYLYIEM